ncbi:MAG: DEAD/DEAH box helicase [Proteobacteria bacterium]|nr:DEAD/DEAH box helicase [Pseudomonadota bacterium]
MSFTQLGLTDALLRALSTQGYTEPTPIQAAAIPEVLAGHDLLAAAQTGTGKTAGFVLPLLQRLAARRPQGGKRRPRALIVTPTRELAAQVEASVRAYGAHLPLTSMTLFGGVGFGGQQQRLARGVDIVVATPGRLLDHHAQRNVDLSGIETLVLDEADRMLDMGFIPDVRRIVAAVPRDRQTLLFSATFSDDIRALAQTFLRNPRTVEVAPRNSTVQRIEQCVHPVSRTRKAELLAWLIGSRRWHQVLVFTRTKHGADKLVQALARDGIDAAALHGNKSQNARTRALADFKQGAITALVATDIAARGIDINELPQVVNYDLPNVPEDYVHRIGRTGRAGADGHAISLVSVDEEAFLRDIERLIRQPIPREVLADYAPDASEKPQNIFAQRGRRGNPAPQPAARHARPQDRHARAPEHRAREAAAHDRRAHAGGAPSPRNGPHAAPRDGSGAKPRNGASAAPRGGKPAPRGPAPAGSRPHGGGSAHARSGNGQAQRRRSHG